MRGFGWNLTATAFNQGSTLVVNLILANLWGLERFGEYAIVQSTLTAFTAVVQPTTGAAAIKYVAELRARDADRAGRILGLCSTVSIVIAVLTSGTLLVGSGQLAAGVLHAPGLTTVLMISSLVVFSTVISGFFTGVLAGLESYPALGRTGIFVGTVYVIVCGVGGWAWGLEGAVIGLAVSALVQCAVLYRLATSEAARHGIRVKHREGWRELSVFFHFVTPAALNSLVAFPAIWLGNAFLVRQPGGYQQMALFAAANTFRILVMFVPAILGNVSLSLLNHQLGADDERRFRRVFWANLGLSSALVLGMGAAIIVTGPWLLGRFGTAFRAGSAELPILMLAAVPEAIAIAILQVLQARERVWLTFFGMVLPGYVSLALLAREWTPLYGARGLAWSYAAAMSLELLAALWIVGRVGLWSRRSTALA